MIPNFTKCIIKEMFFMGVIFCMLCYCSVFNSSRPLHLTRFNLFNLLSDFIQNAMCLINVRRQIKNPSWQFHLQQCCLIFFSANNITYLMTSIYMYTHWKLRSIFVCKYALLNIYYAHHRWMRLQAYRVSKKKLCIVRTSILEKTLHHIDNFRRTLLCNS